MCWDFRTEYNRRAVDKKATRLVARFFYFPPPTFESELSTGILEPRKTDVQWIKKLLAWSLVFFGSMLPLLKVNFQRGIMKPKKLR
jgi:hypothetical protein